MPGVNFSKPTDLCDSSHRVTPKWWEKSLKKGVSF